MITGLSKRNENYRVGNIVLLKTTVNNVMYLLPILSPIGVKF